MAKIEPRRRSMRKKPPAASVVADVRRLAAEQERVRQKAMREAGYDPLDRSNKSAEAEYRERHANGATRVTTMVPLEQVNALAQVKADEVVQRTFVTAVRHWLDYALMGKDDTSIMKMEGAVASFRACRDVLIKAGY